MKERGAYREKERDVRRRALRIGAGTQGGTETDLFSRHGVDGGDRTLDLQGHNLAL